MTQIFQISLSEFLFRAWADQGGVLEGVADKPFFLHSLLTGLMFYCNCKVKIGKESKK